MPKTWKTKREHLVCGKLDQLSDFLPVGIPVEAFSLIESIIHDVNRMEAKLVRRKEQVDRAVEIIDRIGTGACGCNDVDRYHLAKEWLVDAS